MFATENNGRQEACEKVSFFSLWKQFLPLSLSDITMAFCDPAIYATLAHLPEARTNLAALGVAKSQAVVFESPIIMILHTSNVMAPSDKSRNVLKKFMLISIGLLSFLLFLLTLPPIYNIISEKILDIDQVISTKARSILLFLILWPGIIAWRRYFQGILIRTHHDRQIGLASLSRIFIVGIVLAIGYYFNFSGILISGLALILGLFSEAFLITLAAKKYEPQLTKLTESSLHTSKNLPQDIKTMWKFYWPLANSMIFVWGGRALLIGIIARSQDSSLALAAWPVAWGIVLLIGNATRMVQQIIIRHRFKVDDGFLFRFALSVGLFFSLILLFFSGTPLGLKAISSFLGKDIELLQKVSPVILICSGMPLLIAIQNAFQGFLMSEGKSARINISTWIGVGAMLLISIVGIKANFAGASVAAFAMVLALILENIYLGIGIKNVTLLNKNTL